MFVKLWFLDNNSTGDRSVSLMVLRCIAYNSSTKGKCADTKKSEITENCEAGKWGSTNLRTTAIFDGREKDKKVSFDNVTEEGYLIKTRVNARLSIVVICMVTDSLT